MKGVSSDWTVRVRIHKDTEAARYPLNASSSLGTGPVPCQGLALAVRQAKLLLQLR